MPAMANSFDDDEDPKKQEQQPLFTDDIDLESHSSHDPDSRPPSPTSPSTPPPVAAEYSTPASTKFALLAGYFVLNLSLTIFNKSVLTSFRFPWLLTAIHTSFTALGCSTLLLTGHLQMSALGLRENLILVAFSLLFTMNIAMSNISLAAVSVPFHQIMRSTTPIWTIAIYRIVYNRTYETLTYLSLVPVIVGVGLATYGDYYFTLAGFLLTIAGVMLASVKTVVTNRLMTGSLALSALELLLRMSPLAALQALAYSLATGELFQVRDAIAAGQLGAPMLALLAVNGALAFALNVSSFQTNKLAGALTLCIAGNVKQCLTIVLGILLFNVQVGIVNGAGMAVALAGAAWYGVVEVGKKKAAR